MQSTNIEVYITGLEDALAQAAGLAAAIEKAKALADDLDQTLKSLEVNIASD